MRVTDQSSLALDVDGTAFHVVVGPPAHDGTVHCHLLSEDGSAAYRLVVDLIGRIHQLSPADTAHEAPAAILQAVAATATSTWRAALADGLRRRTALSEALEHDNPRPTSNSSLRRAEAVVAALECDDPQLQPSLAQLAPTWHGTIDQLYTAAREASTTT